MIKNFCLFVVVLFYIPYAYAYEIRISHGKTDATPIAINDFEAQNHTEKSLSEKIIKVIKSDLNGCGFFHLVSNDAFIEKKVGISHTPLFQVWRQINTTILLNGIVKQLSSKRFEVSVILWDVLSQKDIEGEILKFDEQSWRRVAHKIADKIYERLTGNSGYFDTKIAYISEVRKSSRQVIKRLAIMDQDGENHRYLSDGRYLVLTPRFSPKSDKLLYISYASRFPKVILKNLVTGRDKVLGDFPGMSFAPRFSPDGNKAIMSIAQNGKTNIVEINLRNMEIRALTNSSAAINTSPTYSPKGDQIVFNSDRGGSGQLYVMSRDGSDVNRISFGEGAYFTPVWSPNGEYIAFTKKLHGQFYIGVLKPDGSAERIIAQGYLVESPSWAPNSRVIVYTKEDHYRRGVPKKSRVFAVDVTGRNEYELPTPHNASDPEWSKLLD